MRWSFVPASAHFSEFRQNWDSINHSHANHVLLDSDFVEPLIGNFPQADLMLGINENSARSMALLHSTAQGLWATFQPSQAPMGMLLFDKDETGDQIKGLLKSLPGYALQLSVLQQDPDYSAWPRAIADNGVEVLDYIDVARVSITTGFEEYWASRSSNLRHNLARQRRRLSESGRALEFVVRRRMDEVPAAVAAYGELESQGWKSETGTAIAPDNAQGRFYTDVLERFSSRNETLIFQLFLDGKLAASELCLLRGGMLVVLKTTYDETLKPLSPALLLRQSELEWVFAQGDIKVIEFYGRAMDWHRQLTDDLRTMYHLNCYRHSWAPKVKQMLRNFQ